MFTPIVSKDNKEPIALILFGSPRKNGYTKKLLDEFLINLKGYRIVLINAYEEAILPCVGCDRCKQQDACQFDDFDSIDSLLQSVDLIIVATPVYNLTFPAPLKAIFDRTQRYFSKRFVRGIKPPIEKKKKAVLLLSCGSNDPSGEWVIEKQLKMIFSVINTTLFEKIVWYNTDNDPPLEPLVSKMEQTARALSIKNL